MKNISFRYTIRALRGLSLAVTLILAMATVARAVPIVLQPEDEATDLVLQQKIINQDITVGALPPVGLAAVGPYHDDNTMRMLASAGYCRVTDRAVGDCSSIGSTSAFARGELFFEFCVPVSGSTECGVGSGPAEDITVTLALNYDMEGRLLADLTGIAKYAASVRVDDEDANYKSLYFNPLADESAKGSIKIIKIDATPVPVPIPGFPAADLRTRLVFQVTVTRGHMNRFAFSAAARGDSGIAPDSFAGSYFTTGQPLPTSTSHVSLSNVDISAGAAVPTSGVDALIEELLAKLEEVRGWLDQVGLQFNNFELATSDQLASMNEVLSSRIEEQNASEKDLQAQVIELQKTVLTLQEQLAKMQKEQEHHEVKHSDHKDKEKAETHETPVPMTIK